MSDQTCLLNVSSTGPKILKICKDQLTEDVLSQSTALIERDNSVTIFISPNTNTQGTGSDLQTGSPNTDNNDSIPTLAGESESYKNSIGHKQHEFWRKKLCFKNVYSTVATTVVVALLLLYVLKAESKEEKGIQLLPQAQSFRFLNLDRSEVDLIIPSTDWKSIEKMGSNENIIHFTVGENRDAIPSQYLRSGYVTTSINGEALRVAGKPNFCYQTSDNDPKELKFKGVSHLHLSDMEECHNYVNLILAKWHFPRVYSIRLHKMIIRKQEFDALTMFISRHNETLHKVEIDESYICPSPDCDAGMIDFPNHDFKLIITRRREVAKYV